ncbi:MAG: aspartate carbamoyltransferase catalytic subunit [Alphaproteobacteria bacterium CG_4_9_14_3_um_filter_47_13]|nr:MAG: aspartate carbamoyltransferase catalytic subunit [Alphaproteobacteria bacterium CG_4_9_14_3_um_filter_47_13]
MKHLTQKHLTGIDSLSIEDIETILDLAETYTDKISIPSYSCEILKGRRILSLFFEDSTRTRVSFEMAAKNLGADWINIDLDRSSLTKGESLPDTLHTLEAIVRPDALVVRHHEYGAPQFIARHVNCPVINAGDSWREHPTQALLDALAIRRHKGTIKNLNIAICGDISHSRVAASNILLLSRLGANLRIIAPPALMPAKFPVENIAQFTTMEEGLKNCDIIMTLRLQKERMEQSAIPSEQAYFNEYGLTRERLSFAKPDSLIMHPGPLNRNVEIADDIADDPDRSLILKQVSYGVPVRMAVMDLLLRNQGQ